MPHAQNLSGGFLPFEGEADDEAAGAQLVKRSAEGRIILDEDVAHSKFGFEFYRKFEEGKKEVSSRTKIEAGVVFGQLEDVPVLQTLVYIGLGLHVPADFTSNEGVRGKVPNALRPQFDHQREIQKYTFGAHRNRGRGSVAVSKPIQHAPVLETQAWNETHADGFIDIE